MYLTISLVIFTSSNGTSGVSLKFTVRSASRCLKYILSTSLTVLQFLTPHSFAIRYEILTVLSSTSGKLLLDFVRFFSICIVTCI